MNRPYLCRSLYNRTVTQAVVYWCMINDNYHKYYWFLCPDNFLIIVYKTPYDVLWAPSSYSGDSNRHYVVEGAQEWHIVSLLGDVTSPTTAVHYVSMTCDLRVLSTEKHCPVRRQHTVYTRVYREKCIVRHWTSREASLRHSSGWGIWRFSPQHRDLRTRVVDHVNHMGQRRQNEIF